MADLADDLLYGVEAIAKFTGLPVRRVYYLAENKLIPAFKRQKESDVVQPQVFAGTPHRKA